MAGLVPSPAGPIPDLRSMDELLRIPILGIESAIVIPAVLADEFEIKPTLIDFVSNNPFYGFEEEDPHSHIRRFYQITRTLRLNQVPDDVVKLILFPFKNFDNMCDVPSCDKKQFDAESDLMESLLNRDTLIIYSPKIDSLLEEFAGELAPINPIPPGIHEADFDPKEDIHLDDQMFYDYTSSDDDSFEDINYVEASPPDSKLVNIEEVEDDILRAKLSNIYLFIAKFESLNDNPTLSFLSHSDNSLPEFETFSNHTEETRSGSTTTHAENSLPEYDSFHFEIKSDQDELSRAVMETIDEIDAFLDINVSTNLEDGYHDSEGDIIYLESLLINDTIPNLSPEFLFIRAGGMRESDDNFSINLFLPQGQLNSGNEYRILRKGQNIDKYGQSRAREGKEDEKSRPKAAPSKIKEIHAHILLEADTSDTKRPRWRSRALSLVELTWHQFNGQDVMIWRQLGLDGYDWKRGERPEG
ncbi:hypothetical protein Tco_0407526 [Tanacetum coccineum]